MRLCISPFFCTILLRSISCTDLNGSVDECDGEGGDGNDSFIWSSIIRVIYHAR